PGFEEQIIGMDVGETKNLDVKFPEDYSAKDMAGKEAVFTVTLNSLSEKNYPELDDEFAKKYGKSDTMEEFREKTKKRLWEQAERDAKNRTESSVLEAVIANATVDIPDRMIEDEKDYLVEDFEQRLKYQYQGVTLDEYVEYMGMTRETFRDQYTSDAEKRIKSRLVMQKLVKEEKIEVSEDEIKDMLTKEAESVGRTYEELKEELSSYNMDYVENDILVKKLVELLESYNELYVEEEKDREEA
ncbi:MAG: trigger factor, partial [Clostridia bacterium]|nr:trigger factor [Clostridia bacterium]